MAGSGLYADLDEIEAGTAVQLAWVGLDAGRYAALDPLDSRSELAVTTRGPVAARLDPLDSASAVHVAVAPRFAARLDPLDGATTVTLRSYPNLANVLDGTPMALSLLARATLLILPPLLGDGPAVTGDGPNTDYDDITGTG